MRAPATMKKTDICTRDEEYWLSTTASMTRVTKDVSRFSALLYMGRLSPSRLDIATNVFNTETSEAAE